MAVDVGIDFGTCFSEIGFYHGEMMALIPNGERSALCPSVFYRDKERTEVGSKAVSCGARKPQFMVEGVKKKLKEPMIALDGEAYEPRQIVTEIFRYLLEGADYNLRNQFQNEDEEMFVTITVPVKFQEGEIRLIREAAESVRLSSGRKFTIGGMLKEPVAAALEYYGMIQNVGENIFVYDLGGGTFDAAIVKSTGDPTAPYEVVGQTGKGIGGYNWDKKMEQLISRELMRTMSEEGMTEESIQKALASTRLQEYARAGKEFLSENELWQEEILVRGEYYEVSITREEFEKETKGLKDETIQAVKYLKRKYEKEPISRVIMVGGGSHMPCIRKAVEEVFEGTDVKVVRPEMAIAFGAARYAKLLRESGEDVNGNGNPVIQKAAHTYGIGYRDENGKKYIQNLIFKDQELPAEATMNAILQENNYFPVFESECDETEERADIDKGYEVLHVHIIRRGKIESGTSKQILTLKTDHTLELTVVDEKNGGIVTEKKVISTIH